MRKFKFLIAPTMYMKTKVKSRRGSIAPTMLMKMNELIDFQALCHDITEKQAGYCAF